MTRTNFRIFEAMKIFSFIFQSQKTAKIVKNKRIMIFEFQLRDYDMKIFQKERGSTCFDMFEDVMAC